MRKIVCILVMFPMILFSQSAKSKAGDLIINKLKNGNIELENNYIRFVVSPKDSGKIVALANKKSLEELMKYENTINSGIGEDIFDIIYPGNEMKPYGIKSAGFGKNEENIYVELTSPLREILNKDILLRKKYTLDRKSPTIFMEVELINNSSKSVKIKYGMKNWLSFGETGRKLIIANENEIEEIPFMPFSGEHGGIFSHDGFMAISSKDIKSSVLLTYDKENILYIDSFHKKDSQSLEIYTKEIELEPKKSFLLKSDLVVLEDINNINAANVNINVISTLTPEIKSGKIFITGSLFKYGKETLDNLKLKISLLDENDKEISTIANENIATLSWETPYNVNLSSDITKIKSPRIKLFYQLIDSNDMPIFSVVRKVEITKQKPSSPIDKNLTVNIVFNFNTEFYLDNIKNSNIIENTTQSYSNVLNFIEKKSKIRFDIAINGITIYNFIKNNPNLIDRLSTVINKKNVNLLASGFSDPLFPMISKKDIEVQIAYDKNLKNSVFGVKPEGIFFPELAFDNTSLEPIVKNEITYCYLSDVSVLKGYKNFPDMNYYAPSRMMSTGFGMNALIVDSKAKSIIERKSDKAINDLLNYIIEIQNKNKDGKNHLVLLIDAEKWSDITFLEKLFTALEEIKWIKFSSSDDIFKAFIPTQIILGEKVSGSIFFDPETKETSFYPWYEPVNRKSKLMQQIIETGDILTRNLEKINIAKENYKEKDFSFAENLYNNANESFIFSVNANYFKGNNEENIKISENLIDKSRKTVAGIYDILIGTIKNQKLKIPNWKENATLMNEDERILAFNKLKTKIIPITDRKINPDKVTSFSIITVDFKLPENVKDIDYNNIYLIFNINGSEEYYKIKADLSLNGRIKATLGNTKSGDELACYIYFKDKKNNTYISDKFNIITE
ncbi:MAG: hypothetical protein N2258_08085 [Brevinematales bacterium]|nr:hypothetical protein [Brevinematales bacterium]